MDMAMSEFKIKAKMLLKYKRSVQGSIDAKSTIQLKDCLTLLSRKIGFPTWEQARHYLMGKLTHFDSGYHGNIWYEKACAALNNHWFSQYEEAAHFLSANPELFLVPYKRHFAVVNFEFLEVLGFSNSDKKIIHSIKNDLAKGYAKPAWDKLVHKRLRYGLQISQVE